MISYLAGKIILKKQGFIILEVQGVGYEVFVSERSIKSISEIGSELKLFCYLDVGERSLRLFGFKTFEELELFKIVRSISGVGPKAALEISAIGSAETIKKEIEKGNEQIFEKVPGIGRKKAQKITLELAGKLKTEEPKTKEQKNEFENNEAFLALVNLGFPKDKVKQALSQLSKDIKNPEEKIKQGLQILGK